MLAECSVVVAVAVVMVVIHKLYITTKLTKLGKIKQKYGLLSPKGAHSLQWHERY